MAPAQSVEAIRAVDPLLPLSGQHSMTDVMAAAMSQQRLLMSLVGVLAAAALLLAAIGISRAARALDRRAPARIRHPDGARRDTGAKPSVALP